MITLYGAAASRASRSLLALEELELPYTQVPLNPWSDAADAEPLARINPNARVPVLDDDGLILWESMAINLYLADRYGGAPFWPQHARERAFVYQWSLWSQTEIDVVARHMARFSDDAGAKGRAEAERLAAAAAASQPVGPRGLRVAASTWLAGQGLILRRIRDRIEYVATCITMPTRNGPGTIAIAAGCVPWPEESPSGCSFS